MVLLLLAGSGFALHHYRRGQKAVDLPTAKARQGDFLVLVRCRGELGAQRSVQLTAPLDVADLQIVWLAPPGGPVKAGDTVIKFDPSRTQQELKEKTAALHQAQASLDQALAQAKITAEQDKLDQATATYQVERARLEASKQSIVSSIQGQESEIDLSLSKEKLKVQQAGTGLHGKSDEAKIASLARLRDEAQSQVALTEHRLTLMELKTPINGVITYLPNTSQGWMNAQPFKVGDHAFPGGVLAQVPDLSTLQMESKVEEVDRGRVVVGDSVLVHVDAFPEKVLTAKLSAITPLTEQSFNEWPPTRSFRAYALIENPDPRMRPGMNAGADVIETKIRDAISIPAKALFTVRGKSAVYLKTADRYVAANVKVTARNPDEIAIEGIPAGSVVALAEPAPEKP
jgi:multidrug efflux pump subunit AcrA (membrane-fusion protein)